jgi:uncharacterized protein
MKAKRVIGVVALAVLSLGPVMSGAQAFAVGADGKMQQEKQAPTISPEDQPTAEQLAKLFEVMRIKQQMASMRSMTTGMVQQQIQSAMKQVHEGLPAGSKPDAELQERMQAVVNKYVAKAMELYPADEMLTDMTGIYQKHLTKEDVESLIAFYSSPAGQDLLNAQPAIAQEYMPMVMAKVTQRSQAMIKEMMAEMEELEPAKKSSASKPATKAPAH